MRWSVVPQACLLRRATLDKAGEFSEDLVNTEDQELFLRCLLAGAQVLHKPETITSGWSHWSGLASASDARAHCVTCKKRVAARWLLPSKYAVILRLLGIRVCLLCFRKNSAMDQRRQYTNARSPMGYLLPLWFLNARADRTLP